MNRSTSTHCCALQVSPRRGVTLVELLVVMAILMMVTAAAIPVIAPSRQSRKVRDAAALVGAYLSQARSKAIELQRPVGVHFIRSSANQLFCDQLSMVEVPPSLSVGTVSINSSGVVTFSATVSASGGDTLLVNGWRFTLNSPTQVNLAAAFGNMPVPPWVTNSTPMAYQLLQMGNMQARRSVTPPLQLPSGAGIDLYCSGMGFTSAVMGITNPAAAGDFRHFQENPVLLFGPTGQVTQVSTYGSVSGDPIFFLIGRSEGVSYTHLNESPEMVGTSPNQFPATVCTYLERTTPRDKKRNPENLFDPNNLWVTVFPTTGEQSTIENGPQPSSQNAVANVGAKDTTANQKLIDDTTLLRQNFATFMSQLANARQFAIQRGGR